MRKRILPLVLIVVILVLSSCSNTAPPTETTTDNSATSSQTTEMVTEPSESTDLSPDEPGVLPTDSAEIPNIEDAFPGEVLYEGIPVSVFFQATIDEVVNVLGTPVDNNDYTCIYDDISFYRDEEGKVTSVESFNLDAFTLEGNALDKDRTGLVGILGEPSKEGDGGSGHELTFYQEKYTLTLATGDYESPAWRIFVYPDLSETWAQQKVEVWLAEAKVSNSVSIAIMDDSEGEADENYHSYVLFEGSGDSVKYITEICVNKKTGELFSRIGDGGFTPLNEWYTANYVKPTNNNGGSSDKVSADGYIVNSGSTVYISGGGWSLMGSMTEGVINFKTDGTASITWVAVYECMGLSGWQGSKLYDKYGMTKYYSPTVKREVSFTGGSNLSMSKLYIDPKNITR